MNFDYGIKMELGTPGEPGKRPEFRVTTDAIEWRYVGDDNWSTLIMRSQIEGNRGISVLDIAGFPRADGGVDMRFDLSDGTRRILTFTLLTPEVENRVDQLELFLDQGEVLRLSVEAAATRATDAADAAATFDPASFYLKSEIDAILANKADLAGGTIPENQIPAIAISDIFEVASQAAMLALNVQRGDIAVRSDLNQTFILRQTPATNLANWTMLRTPTDTVLSVAGKTGSVVLVANDISDATTAGKAFLVAPGAAEQRTLLGMGSMAQRALTISTSAPAGGADGDVWFQVT